jgi:hypothetical protein
VVLCVWLVGWLVVWLCVNVKIKSSQVTYQKIDVCSVLFIWDGQPYGVIQLALTIRLLLKVSGLTHSRSG